MDLRETVWSRTTIFVELVHLVLVPLPPIGQGILIRVPVLIMISLCSFRLTFEFFGSVCECFLAVEIII